MFFFLSGHRNFRVNDADCCMSFCIIVFSMCVLSWQRAGMDAA